MPGGAEAVCQLCLTRPLRKRTRPPVAEEVHNCPPWMNVRACQQRAKHKLSCAADQVERQQDRQRVLVHCMTGVTKCGACLPLSGSTWRCAVEGCPLCHAGNCL